MLHEVLLALSGHPSPLFDSQQLDKLPAVTPSEHALLDSIGRLARTHRALKRHVQLIASRHPSVICRAVASAIANGHLLAFQNAILVVEKQILTSDSNRVAAYNAVPLAGIVSSFSGWHRLIEWYWETACFMLLSEHGFSDDFASDSYRDGPATINHLRKECSTGYPDIEKASLDLSRVAEQTWLRLFSSWLLKGEIPQNSQADFFLQRESGRTVVVQGLLPDFLPAEVASSMLYIGKTLNYMSSPNPMTFRPSSSATNRPTPSSSSRVQYIRKISTLKSPFTSSEFAGAVVDIRSLLSANLTQTILPVEGLLDTLARLRDFFMIRKPGFAESLITESGNQVRARSEQMKNPSQKSNALAGIVMRDSEAGKILANTWAAMASALRMDQTVDTQLEWARENIVLMLGDPASDSQDKLWDAENAATSQQLQVPRSLFGSFLLPTHSHLSLVVKAPLDLFLASKDIEAYAVINSYLVAIRRAHMRSTNLWNQSHLRKGASTTVKTASSYKYKMFTSRKTRERSAMREKKLRSTWASVSATMFFLTELGEYLNSEVVAESWNTFYSWFHGREYKSRSAHSRVTTATDIALSRPQTAASGSVHASFATDFSRLSMTNPAASDSAATKNDLSARQDPEILSEAHRQYLRTLIDSLLLTQESFTRSLSALLVRLDQVVALVLRLQSVQDSLDLHDEGVDDGFSEKYASEEREVVADLRMANDKLKASFNHTTEQLRAIGASAPSMPKLQDAHSRSGFVPWNDGNVDRLLLRLDLKLGAAAVLPT